jgi:hypothetical protein
METGYVELFKQDGLDFTTIPDSAKMLEQKNLFLVTENKIQSVLINAKDGECVFNGPRKNNKTIEYDRAVADVLCDVISLYGNDKGTYKDFKRFSNLMGLHISKIYKLAQVYTFDIERFNLIKQGKRTIVGCYNEVRKERKERKERIDLNSVKFNTVSSHGKEKSTFQAASGLIDYFDGRGIGESKESFSSPKSSPKSSSIQNKIDITDLVIKLVRGEAKLEVSFLDKD